MRSSREAHGLQSLRKSVFFLWCVCLCIELLFQSLVGLIRTSWGIRTVPTLLVKLRVIAPGQEQSVVQFFHPTSFAAIPNMEKKIASVVPSGAHIFIHSSDKVVEPVGGALSYELYPTFVSAQIEMRSGDGHRCLVDVQSSGDLDLNCSGFRWHCPADGGPCN
jgi:hypothetical protein